MEQLFLYHNAIKKIEGLENCLKLEELNLSCNKIRKVENIGNLLVNLKSLMLSANKIEYFEDINEISQLPRLQKLSFCCENFGECPVTEIANYREYVLSQLTTQQLESFSQLDSVIVHQEDIVSS